jgi:glucose/arabinose dehydrogenase
MVEGFGVKSELVMEAEFPVTMAFAPDGRLFYNELLNGNVRVITADGRLLEEPFAHVDLAPGAVPPGEIGLIGLTLDPDFESNHYVYIYFTGLIESGGGEQLTLMRFTDVNSVGTEPTVIGELPRTLPGVGIHVGGNIRFGPDGYLYVTIGENTVKEASQDLSSVLGKILRINKEDGSAAPDNPFVDQPGADPRIFAYGFRNSWDFTFHPETGEIYATENGDANCGELNRVVRGGNYGWPESSSSDVCHNPGATEAIYYFTIFPSRAPYQFISTVAPTGIEFVTSDAYPLLIRSSLLICESNPAFMRHFYLEGEDQDVVVDGTLVVRDCRLDIVIGPDGLVYYSNENEIRRLVPE